MPRSTGRRTDYTWNGGGVRFGLGANTTGVNVMATAGVSGTFMRSRGEILASIDSPVLNDGGIMAFGLIKVTEEQVAVGATAMPNPNDDLDADWMWHGFIPLQAVTEVTAGGMAQEAVGRLTIDSKAMRKVKQTEAIVLISDWDTLSGTPAVDVAAGVRLLFGA